MKEANNIIKSLKGRQADDWPRSIDDNVQETCHQICHARYNLLFNYEWKTGYEDEREENGNVNPLVRKHPPLWDSSTFLSPRYHQIDCSHHATA